MRYLVTSRKSQTSPETLRRSLKSPEEVLDEAG
jgi:hypothetical protein